ncbi:hypothetical protein ABMY26_18570 [Azospirillum sp. HJ39]|uniref:hypothetical protein n=1 Tax=Azospirillum sp. HJ39 TaxID=3159496 RepID=UPI0035561493
MPLRFAERMRGLRIGIGAPVLLLGLILCLIPGFALWSGTASAACPHGEPGAAVSVPADALSTDMAPSDAGHSLSAPSHGRHAQDKHHKAVPSCCTGMACASMHAGLPAGGAAVPVRPARASLPWAAVLLREGLGLRPDLPPPRLG